MTGKLASLKAKISSPFRKKEESETKPILDESDDVEEEDDKYILSGVRLPVTFAAILVLWFFVVSTETLINPFFPGVAKKKGVSPLGIGVVFSIYELARFIASPIAGVLIKKVRPKVMGVIGCLISGIMCIVFGALDDLSNPAFLWSCIAVRFVAGLGRGMLIISVTGILLKITPYRTGSVIGAIEMTTGIGFSLGPAIGAGFYAAGGYKLVFYVLGPLITVSTLILLVVPNVVASKRKQIVSACSMLKIPGMLLVVLHCVIFKIYLTNRNTHITNWLEETFHTPVADVGVIFAVWAIIFTIMCPITSKIINRGYLWSLMIISWVVTIPLNFFTYPSPLLNFIFHGQHYFWLTVIDVAVTFIFAPMMQIPPFQAAKNLAALAGYGGESVQTYGIVMGLTHGARALGSMIGPVAGGALVTVVGLPWTSTIIDFICLALLVLMVIYLIVMKVTKRPLRPEKIPSELGSQHSEDSELAEKKAGQLQFDDEGKEKELTDDETTELADSKLDRKFCDEPDESSFINSNEERSGRKLDEKVGAEKNQKEVSQEDNKN